jgi:hypothetical protein
VTRYQQDRHLKPDGWLAPGGETARNLALDLGGDPGGGGAAAPAAPAGPLALKDAVGDGRANRPDDVVAVKTALAGLGRYGTDRTRAPNPFLDRPLIGAVSAFQKEAGLKQDGWLAPGGETESALTAATAPPAAQAAGPADPGPAAATEARGAGDRSTDARTADTETGRRRAVRLAHRPGIPRGASPGGIRRFRRLPGGRREGGAGPLPVYGNGVARRWPDDQEG